jgi:hypothetical protein
VCPACFETELSKERNADAEPQENVLAPISPVTEVERRITPIRLSSFIPRTRSKIVFALVMACYSVALLSFVSAWAYVAHVRSPPRAFYLRGGSHFISLLIIAPLIESLILVGVFELVRRARAPAIVQVFIAALFISEMHVWPWWPHAVIVLPAFCIQAASYLYWRERASWKDAFWILVSIHALSNVVPALNTLGYATRHA